MGTSMSRDSAAGTIETLHGTWSPSSGRKIDLVFRTIGERTSERALELALRHIQPNKVHIVRDVKPFTRAVQLMLEIDYECSHVVYVDADCLILEDMRLFLDANDLPFVDAYVHDRFRGRVNCGVHIVRLDVVNKMRELPEPTDDVEYVLRPESHRRNCALAQLGFNEQYKNFYILHDYLQHHTDIFSKYAVRELRSRMWHRRQNLQASEASWGADADFIVARHAIEHAREHVPGDADMSDIKRYIESLPQIADSEVRKLGLAPQGPITEDEVKQATTEDTRVQECNYFGPAGSKPKVFGIGLSRTGTHSLTAALHVLGFDTAHNPIDRGTLDTLERGDAHFPLLDHYDGITDITVVPFYKMLDQRYPGSCFILTVRDEESWLESCRTHWEKPTPTDAAMTDNEHQARMDIRRFLRMAVYGSYEMDDDHFVSVYRQHLEDVKRYFAGRNDALLILDITQGEGYEKLAPFLGVSVPKRQFPHKSKSRWLIGEATKKYRDSV